MKPLEDAMYQHAKNLEFEQAAKIRDEIKVLQGLMLVQNVKCIAAEGHAQHALRGYPTALLAVFI